MTDKLSVHIYLFFTLPKIQCIEPLFLLLLILTYTSTVRLFSVPSVPRSIWIQWCPKYVFLCTSYYIFPYFYWHYSDYGCTFLDRSSGNHILFKNFCASKCGDMWPTLDNSISIRGAETSFIHTTTSEAFVWHKLWQEKAESLICSVADR